MGIIMIRMIPIVFTYTQGIKNYESFMLKSIIKKTLKTRPFPCITVCNINYEENVRVLWQKWKLVEKIRKL